MDDEKPKEIDLMKALVASLNPADRSSSTPPSVPMNPTANLAEMFNLLSRRDPMLNTTLYEDAEFAELSRDVYAALRERDDVLSAVVERTLHLCAQQAGNIPTDEWALDYARIKAAARAEIATTAKGEKPCRVCGESTSGMTCQFRTDDDYLPQIHTYCVSTEEQYD